MQGMPRSLLTLFALGSLVASSASATVSDTQTSVVVSIAISSGILGPDDFPIAGRRCDTVLSELREKESFAGRIRASYEPPVDAGRCFNLEGKNTKMAVVCCSPLDQS